MNAKSIVAIVSGSLLALGAFGASTLQARKKFYTDDPIWSTPRPAAVKDATRRSLSDYYDFLENTFLSPGEHANRSGEFLASLAINSVDEVPDSAWYTNRHARRAMTIDELRAGPGDSTPPAPGEWTVVAAKNEGVTPGFRIRDAAGRQYLLKFDPLSNPEMASAADVITSKFFYALGYNVPENYIVVFDRSQIVIGKDAMLKDAAGKQRSIRESDVAAMLAKTPRTPGGQYRAMASRLIGGKPLGPFRYYGTRSDDPNDLVQHEHRRDLRGLRTFCAWLGHNDSRAVNTLDVLKEADGTPFIQHYLIDFGATLGSASYAANSPRDGNAYVFGWKSSAAEMFSLGLYSPKWHHAKYPKLPAVGRFEYEVFDPLAWVPEYPNPAFRNENPADRLWAARKIMAFTDEQIQAIVATGQYTDPAAAEWVTRCLIERRKKIIDAVVAGTAGLDRFEVRDNRLDFVNAGPKAAASVQVAWAVFDNETGRRQRLAGERSLQVPPVESAEYLVAEITGKEGPAISVYVRMGGDRKTVVGVERHFEKN